MRKIHEICMATSKVLQASGVTTYVIIAKCPDSNEIGVKYGGSKTWNIGGCEIAKQLIMSALELLDAPDNYPRPGPPPHPDDYEEDDPADDWKHKK